MTAVGEWRATYAPGDWLVLCGPTSVVVLEPPGAGWTSLVAELWGEVLAASSLPDLAGRLAAYGLESMPSFGALFWTGDGMRSLVRGGVRVVDPQTGRVVADGGGVQTWSETPLATLDLALLQTPQGVDPEALRLPLVVGAVRASAVLLDARSGSRVDSPQGAVELPGRTAADEAAAGTGGAATSRTEREGPAAAEPPLPDTEALAVPAGAATADGTVPLSEDDEAPTEPQPVAAGAGAPESGGRPVPLSVVDGATVLAVTCPHGHPNPPGAARCRDCGVRVLDDQPRAVPQPSLATLRVTDGTELPLDRLVRVGRAPVGLDGVEARLLTVPSPSHDISRTHLEIAPAGWRVSVKDLNSTNGTVLVSPDGVHRRPLPPGEAVPVALGSVLELADGISVLLDVPQ